MGCHQCLLYTRILIYTGIIVLHVTNSLVMLNGFTEKTMEHEGVRNFKRMQIYFFTCWTFMFQILYSALGIYCDWKTVRNTSEKTPALSDSLKNFRDCVFTIFVWPSSSMVATLFWAFFSYDRNLIYPDWADIVVSPLSNHIMHTFILPIALLELVLYPRKKPESHAGRLLWLYGLEAVYICSLFYAYKTTGIWAYPIFEQLNAASSAYLPMFLVVIALYGTVLYYGQYCISTTIMRCWQKIGEKYCTGCRRELL